MRQRIKFKEFESYIPDSAGTVHVNHEDCPAGSDTKRRLYITRKPDGTVLAYCHNCGGSGMSVVGRRRVYSHSLLPATPAEEEVTGDYTVTYPRTAEMLPWKWPRQALEWVTQYGITLKEIQHYGIAYDDSNGRVLLPVFVDDKRQCFTGRKICGSGPKYLKSPGLRQPKHPGGCEEVSKGHHGRVSEVEATEHVSSSGQIRLLESHFQTAVLSSLPVSWGRYRPRVLVVTEDHLSAIKVGRQAKAVACLTSFLPDDLVYCAAQFDHLVIWLDDDNAKVKRIENEAKKRFSLFYKKVSVVRLTDPKRLTDERISEVLDECGA